MKKIFGDLFGQKSGLKLGFLPFSKFGSVVSLEIAYSDSLQQFITSSRDKVHEKNLWGPNLGQNWTKTRIFCCFLKFGSLVSLEIAYNDSLQQFLTSSRDKIYKKVFGAQNWARN